jgi:hypothetical protein
MSTTVPVIVPPLGVCAAIGNAQPINARIDAPTFIRMN